MDRTTARPGDGDPGSALEAPIVNRQRGSAVHPTGVADDVGPVPSVAGCGARARPSSRTASAPDRQRVRAALGVVAPPLLEPASAATGPAAAAALHVDP